MNIGYVFDIRRFSTHDGNGLRTNIFFKGCPLRCVWCQNPEGLETNSKPVWFAGKCIGCGTCLRTSQTGGVCLEDGNIRIYREQIDCWDEIIGNCPAGAITMDFGEYTVQELLCEAMKDQVFFRHGGGVTLSGGEPLLQKQFVLELLQALREKGIHTAIETSLQASTETLENVLPWLNQIYADMKLADCAEHIKYTGVPNDQIRRNLTYLLTSSHRDKVTIRTPLIPGMTATEENLSKIAGFLSGLYTEVNYELLNYNPLAEAKYHLVEREYCFKENPKPYTKAQMIHFGEIVRAYGIKNLIMEI